MKSRPWLKPGVWGAAIGAVAAIAIGFGAGGWVTGGTAAKMASDQSQDAVVAALVPICLEQSRQDPERTKLLTELKAASSWGRDDKLVEIGWATMPGAEAPAKGVADACVEQLAKSFQN